MHVTVQCSLCSQQEQSQESEIAPSCLCFRRVQKAKVLLHCPTDVQPGHIPGSTCVPFTRFINDDGMMLPTEELKKIFEKSNVDLNKPICGTCGSGVTACHLLLAAHLCGAPAASLYDGSWYEWFVKAPPELIVSEVKREL